MLELMLTCFRFHGASRREVGLFNLPHNLPIDATLCTKNPQDHRLVGPVLEHDEQHWFISMVRDPRDVVVSRHGMRPDVYWANLRQWREWYDNVRAYRTHARLIEVRYESLIAEPNSVQEMIAARLPFLPQRGSFSRYYETATPADHALNALNGFRPLSNASIGNWRRHLPRLAGQLEVHGAIDAELITLGYESNQRWLETLKGIQPDTRPGRWQEHLPVGFLEQTRKNIAAKLPAYLAAWRQQ